MSDEVKDSRMGIRERLVKALALPAGATTQTPDQIVGQANAQGTLAAPLERDTTYGTIPFGPSNPLFPFLINEPRSDGRSDPRRWQFPVAWNLQLYSDVGRTVPFDVLRQVSDAADIVRRCIETVKAAIIGMDWDIAINEDAIARVMAEQNIGNTMAAKIVREQLTDEIVRVKEFWRSPDRINGLSFQEWLGMLLEEVLVIDALAIYPNRVPGDPAMASLEILDGATIKPLLDGRGSRPVPPHPAFQQILWGFPRGEFEATPDADAEYTADQLIYAPRVRRANTPYGLSPVERSLPLIDLYLKRLQWLRTEYTDGVPPDMLLKTDGTFGNNPELLKGFERIFNDQLAGNMEERRHAKLLPAGLDPVFNPASDAKYNSEFDEWLVKSITGHFGVLPSQFGFTPRSGLGGTGHQQGEAASTETLGLRPLITWLGELLNNLSRRFVGMAADLSFVFNDGTEDDAMQQATRRQLELFSGQKTWNEIRTEAGMPLFTFPEADSPLLVSGATVLPLSATFEAVTVDAVAQDNDEADDTLGENEKAELATFSKWAKVERQRPFAFKHLAADMAGELNALVATDPHAARHLADAWKAGGVRPKAVREPFPQGHPAREISDRLAAYYRTRLASVGVVDAEQLVAQFMAAPSDDPRGWLRHHRVRVFDADRLASLLDDLHIESAWMGVASARAITGRSTAKAIQPAAPVDWEGWKPGSPDAAAALLGESGAGDGWRQMLENSNVTVQGIENTRLDMIGTQLGLGMAAGASVDEMARTIRDLVGSPLRADMIAHTEMTRAHNAATLVQFKRDGASKVEWQTADANACDECAGYEADGPYSVEEAPQPPAHPWCGCQLLAVEFDNEPVDDEPVDDGEPEPEPESPLLADEPVHEGDEPVAHANVDEQPTLVTEGQIAGATMAEAEPAVDTQLLDSTLNTVREGSLEPIGTEQQLADSLSPQEIAAVRDYTGGAYRELNEELRQREPELTPRQRELVAHLDAVIERAGALPEPVIVYRGMRLSDPSDMNYPFASEAQQRQMMADKIEARYAAGSIVSFEGGYVSTSTDTFPALDASSSKSNPGVVFEIEAHTGAPLNAVTKYDDEYEVLQARNTQYEVVRVERSVEFYDFENDTSAYRTVVVLREITG